MDAERAKILFSPKLPEVPGSFNMVEIRTGGDALLRRLRRLCGELARGERPLCDLIRELPAEGVWVSEFRAHHGKARGEKGLTIVASPDMETAAVDWRNTTEGWDRVCKRLDHLLGIRREGIIMPLCDDEENVDGFLSVER